MDINFFIYKDLALMELLLQKDVSSSFLPFLLVQMRFKLQLSPQLATKLKEKYS
jgi:hypothetical protein